MACSTVYNIVQNEKISKMSANLFILQSRGDKLSIMIVHGSILLNTTAHPKDIIPRRGLITGAKVHIFLHLRKKMAKK